MSKKSDSLPASTGGDPNDILAFLESAPESIRGWAGEQSKLIRQELDAQATSVKPATTASAPLDENETALAELDEFEEEVPVFRKRAKAKAARKAAKPASENAVMGRSGTQGRSYLPCRCPRCRYRLQRLLRKPVGDAGNQCLDGDAGGTSRYQR